MKVIVLSPDKKLFEDDVVSVNVPGEKGSFEVLENHAPIISTLVSGEVVCKGSSEFRQTISNGFIEVLNNVVTICVK